MTIDAYTALTLALRTGMMIPVHNAVEYEYFPGTRTIEIIHFFLNESEIAHIVHFYVGGIPTSDNAILRRQQLGDGPFIR
jgi:hypothetical protein